MKKNEIIKKIKDSESIDDLNSLLLEVDSLNILSDEEAGKILKKEFSRYFDSRNTARIEALIKAGINFYATINRNGDNIIQGFFKYNQSAMVEIFKRHGLTHESYLEKTGKQLFLGNNRASQVFNFVADKENKYVTINDAFKSKDYEYILKHIEKNKTNKVIQDEVLFSTASHYKFEISSFESDAVISQKNIFIDTIKSIFEKTISYGANPNQSDRYGALFSKVYGYKSNRMSDIELVSILLDNGLNVESSNNKYPLFSTVIQNKHFSLFKKMIDLGVFEKGLLRPEARNHNLNHNILADANFVSGLINGATKEYVEYALEHIEKINQTALIENEEYNIRLKAFYKTFISKNKTNLIEGLVMNYPESLLFKMDIFDISADMTNKNSNHTKLFTNAPFILNMVYKNNHKIIKKLINKGFDVHIKDHEGNNAWHYILTQKTDPKLIDKNYEKTVELLISEKVNFNAKNDKNKTPFELFLFRKSSFEEYKALSKAMNFDYTSPEDGGNLIHEVISKGSFSNNTFSVKGIPIIKDLHEHGVLIQPQTVEKMKGRLFTEKDSIEMERLYMNQVIQETQLEDKSPSKKRRL